MKIPGPVRKFYDFFPLKTYEQPHKPAPQGVLYAYNRSTVDPSCVLARAILTWYDVPYDELESSPYITPASKLPVLVQGSSPLYIEDLVAKFVPEDDRQEVELLAVVEKARSAYFRLVSSADVAKNYLRDNDQQRLWPANKAINRQTEAEVRALKGYFDTSDAKLAIALEVLEDSVTGRQALNFSDLAIYSVTKALDQLIDLPHELQHHLVRVEGLLEPQTEKISIEYEG